MKHLLKKFEEAMVAVTFAEYGEFDTAQEILKQKNREDDGGPVLKNSIPDGKAVSIG